MKRCPECGYRVKADDLRDCPLCGVRMRDDPGGRTVRIETHVHEADGEKCLLPNPGEKKAVRESDRVVFERRLKTTKATAKKAELPRQLKQLMGIVVVLILYVLMNSCGA